jgi:hypothetical protein
MITQESLRILENNLVFTSGVNREYDDRFGIDGAKVGESINVRKPSRYVGTTGAAISIEDHTETSVPVALTTQFHVDTSFTTRDLTLSLDEFSDRVLKPKIAVIANKIDRDGLTMAYQSTYNAVGTPGTAPSTALAILQAGGKLDEFATPRDGNRNMVVNPDANINLVNAMSGFFNPTRTISDNYTEGSMTDLTKQLGFKFGMDQNVVAHTVGALGGTPLVNGASQTGASVITDGWTASVTGLLKKGDVFTIANVFAVNPQSRQSTGKLQQFVVTADTNSIAGGAATIPISPSIVTSGAFQTVTNSPADNAAITVVGTAATAYANNMAYHRDAFTLVSAPLQNVSQFGAQCSVKSWKNVSLRVTRQYAIGTDTVVDRIDVLYGWAPLYPELACRLLG